MLCLGGWSPRWRSGCQVPWRPWPGPPDQACAVWVGHCCKRGQDERETRTALKPRLTQALAIGAAEPRAARPLTWTDGSAGVAPETTLGRSQLRPDIRAEADHQEQEIRSLVGLLTVQTVPPDTKSSFMILEHPGSSGGSKRGRLGFGYAAPLVA